VLVAAGCRGGAAAGGAARQPSTSTRDPRAARRAARRRARDAQKILAHREEHGGFDRVEDLGQVPGIGEKRMARSKDLVTA
jgi:competence protein ComEA